MSTTTHSDRDQIFDQAAEVARHGKGTSALPGEDLVPLLAAYYRHVSTEELDDRSDVDVYGAYASHHHLGAERKAGTTKVRVYTPTVAEHGWSAGGHSVVEVVTDDMSFLVDSLTMELARQHRNAHLVLHPTLDVERNPAGQIVSLHPVSTGSETPHEGVARESWMHVEIDRLTEEGSECERLAEDVRRVLGDVRAAVEDWSAMQDQARTIVADLGENPPPLPEAEVAEGKALLEWLADEHFTFLGYREYQLERVKAANDGDGDGAGDNANDVLRPVPGSGLGILRDSGGTDRRSSSFQRLSGAVKAKAREMSLLVLAKANSRATVHRPAYLDYVGVKVFGSNGEVVGERRFLGLFSSAAYTESVLRVPLLRVKVADVLETTGLDPRSHDGNALLDTLETYPRDELFHTPTEELAPIAEAAMQARERRAVRMFIRRDIYDRYLSVLIYLPRDRYNTSVRQKFVRILAQVIGEGRIDPDSIEFNVSISESTTARVHFVVRMPVGETIPGDIDTHDLERRLIDASRSWHDDFLHAVSTEYGEEVGAILARRYVDAFPEAYKEDFPARTAAVDLGRLEAIRGGEGIDQALYSELDAPEGEARLKVFRVGPPLSLSEVLPMLSSMGVEVVDERPYGLAGLDQVSHIYDFGLRYGGPLPDHGRELFSDALRAIWDGYTEIDGFNALVLRASLTWRQAMLLRAYAKYMRQGNSPFAIDSIEGALAVNVELAKMLVTLFETRFDPDLDDEPRDQMQADLEGRIKAALDDVVSLDHDRILRSYLVHIRATLRTNYFQYEAGGKRPKPYLSLKLEPSAIPDLPEPRPKFEIFVYSPRVEGVHLRFGAVARGGLRWSDRRDDFRTEILGLVKAQMVKNTVIVPVGAKGGFYAKQLPDPAGDGGRDAWLAEGIECYKTFIRGLLDVTDNLVTGEHVLPPRRVVRHDSDDSYLVVAADKGTATFSDIANGVSADYGFWLGDAFASGGSVGYDHKAMGITARGAWVSVRRHFREIGVDCQEEDITVVGVGDMSGDVFGNGMLCSEHIRLVAAFDHRDIFIDPEPDAATSYAERRRLFDLPRSSWQDYDKSLISEGGGVFRRSAKSIPINNQIRAALGIHRHVDAMTPAELMKAILLAPVDLLWNGGIGTYVKASSETNADAGDKANDAIRVNGTELQVRVVGEGGNLGCTQRGRIEFANNGGRINTDFIDNSAGVDTSDREVNLKILLDRVVADGDLTEKQRNKLLASMTDDVAELVLRDNYEQNIALANAARNAPSLLHVHELWMQQLEREGRLDRDLEALPTKAEVKKSLEQGGALSQPELAVLMAYTKIVLAEELLASDLPEDPYLLLDLVSYFPKAVRDGFSAQIEQHPLRREIIVTQVVGDLVNGAGMTYWPRLAGETGASAAELTRANFVAREIFGSLPLRKELATYDNKIDAAVQTRMRVDMRTLVERASRWLVTNRRPPLDSQATVDLFAEPVQAAMLALPDLLVGKELAAYDARRTSLVGQGVPEELAARVSSYDVAYALLNVVDIAARDHLTPTDVARVHFALGDRLGISLLQRLIVELPRADQWQTMARASLRDDLHSVHAQLTAQVLATTSPDEEIAARGVPEELREEAVRRVAEWESATGEVASRAVDTLGTICADEDADLARVSVALRVVRGLLA